MTDDGDRADGYDRLADETDERDGWDSPWGDNPLQEHYSWPATRALLPDLAGSRVLAAGCGVGDHVEELLAGGASVVGVDASERAIERARERYGDRAEFRVADLSESLSVDPGRFDAVLSHLALDHLRSLETPFASFRRTLPDDGVLVFAVVHPMQYYLAYDAVERYYDRTRIELGWDADVDSYHRPLSAILNPLADAGFRLERFVEPRPDEAYRDRAAPEWNVDERPQVCCVRASPAAEG